eukprot:1179485-Prorocentrum_minimum.AAC.2
MTQEQNLFRYSARGAGMPWGVSHFNDIYPPKDVLIAFWTRQTRNLVHNVGARPVALVLHPPSLVSLTTFSGLLCTLPSAETTPLQRRTSAPAVLQCAVRGISDSVLRAHKTEEHEYHFIDWEFDILRVHESVSRLKLRIGGEKGRNAVPFQIADLLGPFQSALPWLSPVTREASYYLSPKAPSVRPLQTHAKERARLAGSSNEFALTTTLLLPLRMQISKLYRQVPYHGFRHALDVTHSMYMFLTVTEARGWYSDLEKFALVLAAMVHDVDHPGQYSLSILKGRYACCLSIERPADITQTEPSKTIGTTSNNNTLHADVSNRTIRDNIKSLLR